MMDGGMGTMMLGCGLAGFLVLIVLVFLIAALLKYLFSGQKH
jgi:hypothetical protein